MKCFFAVLLLMSLSCQSGHGQTADEVAFLNSPARVIPLADCDAIDTRTASGWWLSIQHDGSARLGFGSGMLVDLPAGSFPFVEVYKKLSALKFDGIGISRDPSVGFHERDAHVTKGLSTSDHQPIKELFQMARAGAKNFDGDRWFASTWEEHPPER